MDKSQIIHIVISIGLLVLAISRLPIRYQRKNFSFEKQLKIFENLGFVLNEGVTKENILKMYGEEAYKKEPLSLLYIALGSTIEKEPWTPITNQAWHFDTEAIEHSGAYVEILKNLERISRGELKFTSVSDVIDFKNEKASISFKLNGDSYNYGLKFEGDWVDPIIFTKIVELTHKYNTKGKFTYFDTGGQDLVIGFSTEKELLHLRKKTGLNIVWLN